MKVIIAGGRDFHDFTLLKEKCKKILGDTKFEIVTGMAGGADRLGLRFAHFMKVPYHKFPADWNKFGKGAGFKRNAEMAEFADALIAFWDGKSRGTAHMIQEATKKNLKVRIIKYNQ